MPGLRSSSSGSLLSALVLLASTWLAGGCGGAYKGAAYIEPVPLEPLPAAYVLTPGSGEVVAIDRDRLEIVSTIQVAPGPTDMVSVRSGYVVYAVSPGAGTVSVIDTTRVELIAEVRGTFGSEIFAAPDAQTAYLLSSSGQSLTAIDATSHEVMSSIWLSSAADDVEFLFEESRAFCMIPRKGRIAVVDTAGFRVIDNITASFSSGLSAYASGSDYFYAASPDRTYIDVISISRLGVMNRLQLAGLPGSVACASCEGVSRVCVAVPGARVVSLFDGSLARRVADITCPFTPSTLAVGDGGEVLAVGGSSGEVAFIDLSTAAFLSWPVDVGAGVPLLVPVPESNLMIAVDEDGKASRLNLETANIDSTINTAPPAGCDAVALDAERMKLYIGSADGPSVLVLDIATFTVIAELRLGAAPAVIKMVP